MDGISVAAFSPIKVTTTNVMYNGHSGWNWTNNSPAVLTEIKIHFYIKKYILADLL